jgi:hypothetical protein
MNSKAFYAGVLHELSLIKKADTQVVYPQQQKKPNTFRNLALAGLGAAGLGLGGYAAYKHFGAGNSLPTPNAASGPATPPKPVAQAHTSVDPGLADAVDNTVNTEALKSWVQGNNEKPAPTLSDQLVGAAGQNLNRVGLASSFGAKKLPFIGKGIGLLDKTLGHIPMGAAAKALPIKAFPALGAPFSMYSHLHDTTVPDFYAGPNASEGTRKGIQTAAGAAESAINFHPVGMAGNLARAVGVDIPLANAEGFQEGFNNKSEGYRKMMDYLSKTLQSPDPALRQRAQQASQYLLSQHKDKMDELINPSTFNRMRLNNYNFSAQNMIPGWGQFKFVKDLLPQLFRVDADDQVGGAKELDTLRSVMMQRMNRNLDQRLANTGR